MLFVRKGRARDKEKCWLRNELGAHARPGLFLSQCFMMVMTRPAITRPVHKKDRPEGRS